MKGMLILTALASASTTVIIYTLIICYLADRKKKSKVKNKGNEAKKNLKVM